MPTYKPQKTPPIILPALRGHFGDWVFYSCLMPMGVIQDRVSYADGIHNSKTLSEYIQRSLEGKRAQKISEYLASNSERFFNSLVLAIYGGSPDWLEVGGFKSNMPDVDVSLITEKAQNSLGFLSLSGKEKIFAIDGQHRVAGIKEALKKGVDINDDEISVLLVAHRKDKAGMQRTRRLFTTLNKTAVPVYKKDIIALDEDDVMAIVCRRFVEEHEQFQKNKIAVVASKALPQGNNESISTIVSLYDILRLVFLHKDGTKRDQKLRFRRPSEEKLDAYCEYALDFFEAMSAAFPAIKDFFEANDPSDVILEHRNKGGGHLLFRPAGLEVFTRLCIRYSDNKEILLTEAVAALADIPTSLADEPYRGVLWNPVSSKMLVRKEQQTLALNLLEYVCGLETDQDKLLSRYRISCGFEENDETLGLPTKIAN